MCPLPERDTINSRLPRRTLGHRSCHVCGSRSRTETTTTIHLTPLTSHNSIHSVGFVQSFFWRNAGFEVIRKIPQLRDYAPRYNPIVIPVADSKRAATEELPPSPKSRKGSANYHTSADYHALYKSGKLTPTAVVEALLPLIRRDVRPPGKHSVAFVESQVERIRAAAEASTQRYKQGQPLGPLDGVPVAVKDEVHVEGYRRNLGSNLDFKGGFEGTSWCVQKWEEAGAIIIGKTTMHELGLGKNRTSPLLLKSRNLTSTPGGRHHKQQPELRDTQKPSQPGLLLRWLLRRVWLCGRSRPGAHRARRGRRRLNSHPLFLLRDLGPETHP